MCSSCKIKKLTNKMNYWNEQQMELKKEINVLTNLVRNNIESRASSQ